jgi:hypothetical protein
MAVIRTHLSRGLAGTHDARTLYAVDAKGGGRSSPIIHKMSANRSDGMATSAIRKATQRAWLTTFASTLISFSLSVLGDQPLIGSGVASVRRKLLRL